MAFRFVHTADIHLDSPLKSLALKDAGLAERIGTATRQSFAGIIELCLSERVDALLIAGDLYDGDQTSMKTARFLADQFHALTKAGIAVHIIRGNHDAASRITRELTLPEGVTVYPVEGASVHTGRQAGGRPVIIHGLSFGQPVAPDSLLPKYPPPRPGAVNIGMMHTSLGGAPGHDPYAPCSLADLDAAGFDYWALGHIHARAVHRGRSVVVMPGIPQGRDINEAGDKSVSLVTIGDDGAITVAERTSAVARFERIDVDLSDLDDWAGLPRRIEQAIAAARPAGSASHLVARLSLSGTTPLAWQIRRDLDLALAEAQAIADRSGRASIEWLDNATLPLETKADNRDDPVAELARLIETDILSSPLFLDQADELLTSLARALPAELRGLFGQSEAATRAILAELARDGSLDMIARLGRSDDGGAR